MTTPLTTTPRVVGATLRSFICAYERYVEEPYRLGQFVSVREAGRAVYGVVAEIESGPEDPTRPISPQEAPGLGAAEYLAARPELRLLLRTRLSVLACGHVDGEAVRAALPPVPPPLLAPVVPATDAEVVRLTGDGAFLAVLLAAPGCDDAILAAAIRSAAESFGPEGHAFRVRAGKELARLLKAEPARLTTIIKAVTP
ncbi:MAG: hypothetical protein Kow0010_25820 [Dehalococcoidia bacterium]